MLEKASLKNVIYSDGWQGYNCLVDVVYSKYYRVNHSANEFAHLSLYTSYATSTA